MSKLWQLMEFLNKKDPRWNGDRNTEKNSKSPRLTIFLCVFIIA